MIMVRTIAPVLCSVLLGLMATFARASIDAYEFESDAQRQQYFDLTAELRCPKCQNQNIADSNAPIAQDMRREVHRMVMEGASDDRIVDFMVERFGDFVTYRPRFDRSTLLLWLGPAVVALTGIIAVLLIARRHRPAPGAEVTLSDEERRTLRKMLSGQAGSSEKKERQ